VACKGNPDTPRPQPNEPTTADSDPITVMPIAAMTGVVVALLLLVGLTLWLVLPSTSRGTFGPAEQHENSATGVAFMPNNKPNLGPDLASTTNGSLAGNNLVSGSLDIVGTLPAPAPVIQEPAPQQEVEEPRPVIVRPTPPRAKITSPSKEESKPAAKVVVKRRTDRSEGELIKEVENAPELTLDSNLLVRAESNQLARVARMTKDHTDTAVAVMEKRGDLSGLPFRKGNACRLDNASAEHLQKGSVTLRGVLATAVTNGAVAGTTGSNSADPDKLQETLKANAAKHSQWHKSESIPALVQMLMAEQDSIREVLVEQLAGIPGKASSEALAQRAVYDLHPRVREKALLALADRPAQEYRDAILKGFRHPWPAIAEHAAEAIIALRLKETIPTLLTLLDQRSPSEPTDVPGKGKMVKEMVKINHLKNCLMCHAAATSTEDKVRGFVPITTQPLPPSFSREYYASRQNGTFVRADITYLKQDFSIPLPVVNHGVWPKVQRFDFVVRERSANKEEIAKAEKMDRSKPTEHQRSLFFALRELTGKDPGPTAEDWKREYLGRNFDLETRATGFTAASAFAIDAKGKAYVSDGKRIFVQEGDGRPVGWIDAEITSLAFDSKGNLVATRGSLGDVVQINKDGSLKTLAGREARRFTHPRRLVGDLAGGIYFTDDAAIDAKGDVGSLFYLSSHGNLSRVSLSYAHPKAVALSPDGKTLYLASSRNAEVMACELESNGIIASSKAIGKLESKEKTPGAATDLAVSSTGLVCVLNGTTHQVEFFGPKGGKLGTAKVAQKPLACAFGGREGKTLFVLTKTTLYSLDLSRDAAAVVDLR
jgi:sugar lactone lactonase YvrE